jgi:signal transduction histidine kinase
VEFIKDCPAEAFVTRIDVDRVLQVLTNFVTNAVKYTNQGHIKVGWRKQDGGLYVYCEDTGQGIPPEVQDKVFDRFFKLNDYIQGTGLGLAICKAIADAYHGKIGLYSKGVGEGSTFWLWIPCEEKREK